MTPRSTNPPELVALLEAGRLPDPFGHREHLIACWSFLRHYGLLGTLDRLPAALRRVVAAAGQPERYHETMTWAWILAVADQLDDSPDASTFLDRHPELFRGLPEGWAQSVQAPDARRRLVPPGAPPPSLRRVDGVLPEALHGPLTALYALVFEGRLDAPFARSTRPRATTWIAEVGGQIVGFKLGYEERSDTYHSTLGAVDPAFRGLGIGRALMRAQHGWAREQRYRLVTTSTRNRFRAMLHLNLSEGFDVVGMRVTPDGEPKILLEKRLDEPGWAGFQGPP